METAGIDWVLTEKDIKELQGFGPSILKKINRIKKEMLNVLHYSVPSMINYFKITSNIDILCNMVTLSPCRIGSIIFDTTAKCYRPDIHEFFVYREALDSYLIEAKTCDEDHYETWFIECYSNHINEFARKIIKWTIEADDKSNEIYGSDCRKKVASQEPIIFAPEYPIDWNCDDKE